MFCQSCNGVPQVLHKEGKTDLKRLASDRLQIVPYKGAVIPVNRNDNHVHVI